MMKTMLTLFMLLAGISALAEPAAGPAAKSNEVCLADVTVTARPTGKRHESYVFTLKSRKDDASWTFELYQDFGGGLLLYVAGNRTSLDNEKELQSWQQKATFLKLQQIEPQKARTGEMITHQLVSMTWRLQEPNQASEATSEPAPGAASSSPQR
jgi:hypothetical protein